MYKWIISKKGDAGQVMIAVVMLLLGISVGIVNRGVTPTREDNDLARSVIQSKMVQVTGDSVLEDVGYRIRFSMPYDLIESINLNGGYATATVVNDVLNDTKTLSSESNISSSIRRAEVVLQKSETVTFSYAVQVGQGGLDLGNSSSVFGNVYTDGPVVGNNNVVTGTVVSASTTGLINRILVGGDAYAHNISNSNITGDSYYYSPATYISSITHGIMHPGSPDMPTTTMPISDAMIDSWEQLAAAGNSISSPCPYKITSSMSLGPTVINCDVELSGSAVLTLQGPVWIKGNFVMSNTSEMRIDPSLGKSVAFIVDNPANRTTSSKILLKNSANFAGIPSPPAFILLISMSSAYNTGGAAGTPAIIDQNSTTGDVLLYAPYGEVTLNNSVSVKSIVAKKLSLRNSARLLYTDGLESLIFYEGPGGSWDVNGWKEVE